MSEHSQRPDLPIGSVGLDKNQKLIITRLRRDFEIDEDAFKEGVAAYLRNLRLSGHWGNPRYTVGKAIIPCTDLFVQKVNTPSVKEELSKVLRCHIDFSVQRITKLEFSPEIREQLEKFFEAKTWSDTINSKKCLNLSSIIDSYKEWMATQGVSSDAEPSRGTQIPDLSFDNIRLVNVLTDYLRESEINVLILSNNKLADLKRLTCPTGLKNATTLTKLVLTNNSIDSLETLKCLTYIKQLETIVLTDNPVTNEPDFASAQDVLKLTCIAQPPLPQHLPDAKSYRSFKYLHDNICMAITNGDTDMIAALYTLGSDGFGFQPPAISIIHHVVNIDDKCVSIRCAADKYLQTIHKLFEDKVLFIDGRATILGGSTSVIYNPYYTVEASGVMPNLVRTTYICRGTATLRKRRLSAESKEIPLSYVRTITIITPCVWSGSLKRTFENDTRDFTGRIIADVAQFTLSKDK